MTLGCSRHAMSDPADPAPDPVRGPRAEVVLALHGGAGVASGVYKSLAVLAAAPAVEGGCCVRTDSSTWARNSGIRPRSPRCCSAPATSPTWRCPPPPIRSCFEAVPLTATEAAWVRLRGAKALRVAWAEAGIDVRDPHRGAAAL